MQEKPFLKYFFIINKGSGRHAPVDWEKTIRDFFKDKEISFDIFHLPAKFNSKQIKDHIARASPAHVIAVGGDGTVTFLANILAGTNTSLGIIPAGSANGMAKELGIPVDPQEALNIIERGFEKNIDLILLNNKEYCLHLSDIGLNAQLIKYFDEGKLRGKLGYARVIFKTLLRRRKMQVSIRTGENVLQRIVFMAVLANARMYGTGAVINPLGRPDDGKFEIILVRKLSIRTLIRMLLKPRILNPKEIETIPCTSAVLTTKTAMHFQTDGEYKGKVKRITAEIRPAAIKMILPGEI